MCLIGSVPVPRAALLSDWTNYLIYFLLVNYFESVVQSVAQMVLRFVVTGDRRCDSLSLFYCDTRIEYVNNWN